MCGLLLLSEVFLSATTVVPEGQTMHGRVMLSVLVLAIAIGMIAVWLKSQFRRKPDAAIFRSKWVSGVCIAIAAILTLIVVGGVIG
jgi:heme/copper-type cytochrome/quinol oxidase subunit 1